MITAPAHACRAHLSGMIGTAVEWYGYLLISTVAAVVFGPHFFRALFPAAGVLASLATFEVGFVVRPPGGIAFGYFGDWLGRQAMLVVALGLLGIVRVPAHLGRASAEDVSDLRDPAVADLRP